MNTNGSHCHVTKCVAVGGVIRDEDGRILKGYQSFIGRSSVIYVEFVGIWQGLHMCQEWGLHQVSIESDSKLALQLIAKVQQDWN